jgi:Na+/phosphate symporter
MMHSAVTAADLPAVLAYMSIVKDAERVGDYAKNMYDLARYGANFELAEDHDELLSYRDAVGQLIDDAAATFGSQDEAQAQKLIDKADGFLLDYDQKIKAAFRSEGTADQAVARALYYRYLKRITAHIMNMLTAIVMPIERLDYYDEAPEDR